jgi:hypothetical protein
MRGRALAGAIGDSADRAQVGAIGDFDFLEKPSGLIFGKGGRSPTTDRESLGYSP